MDAPARRELLARAMWGATGACAVGIVGVSTSPRIAAAATWRTIARDVACLLNSFTPTDAEGTGCSRVPRMPLRSGPRCSGPPVAQTCPAINGVRAPTGNGTARPLTRGSVRA
jgi:hypothetical protein